MIKVFLGGTTRDTNWRDILMEMNKNKEIQFFDPRVKDWNEEAQKKEIEERETCDYCLYVITPRMYGVYSIAEVVDDSNKRPEKTIFCYLTVDGNYMFRYGQIKSLDMVAKMVEENGGKVCKDLKEIINYLEERC